MSTTYPSKTLILVQIGMVVELASLFPIFMGVGLGKVAGAALFLLATAVLVWGCVRYAAAKGRSGFYGLLGLGGFAGLITLLCLPSRKKVVHT